MVLNDRSRLLIAACALSFGVAVLVMTAIGYHYESKASAIRSAHRDEVASLRRDFNKQLKRRDDALEELKKIRYSMETMCKRSDK